MSKKWSNKKAKDIIEYEGIAYAVEGYCSHKEFKDKKTRKLWKKAAKAIFKLEKYLKV